MPARREHRGSLAAQMVGGTLAIVGVTVLVSSILALAGVYGIVQAEETARLTAYRQIILDGLSSKLTTIDRVIGTLASGESARRDDVVALERNMMMAVNNNVEYFDLLLLADRDGKVVSAIPRGLAPDSVDTTALIAGRSDAQNAVVTWHPARSRQARREPLSGGRLWVAEPLSGQSRRYVLVGRLRSGFVQQLVDQIASSADQRAALLVDAAGTPVASGRTGPPLDVRRIALRSEQEGRPLGEVDGLSGPEGPMAGYWAELPVAADLDWRVLVAEPRYAALFRTRSALLPASLTVMVAALGAIWAAQLFARRLLTPLREFEATARAVSAGAIVRPVAVDRDDEVGRVAEGFNSMLLRLNALQELSQLLARSTRLDEVLDGVLNATARLLGDETSAAVFLLDDSGAVLRLSGFRGTAPLPAEASLLAGGPSWPAQAFRSREPLTFSGGLEPNGVGQAGTATGDGIALPLVAGSDRIGVLVVLSERRRPFSEAEIDMLEAFSAQATVALDNSRLFEDERTARREAEALREVAELLESPSNLEESLSVVASIAADLLDSSCAGLAFASGTELGGIAPVGDDDADQLAAWDAVFEARAERDGSHRPLVIPDAAADPLTAKWAASAGGGAVLLIPLLQGGRRRGVLVLHCRSRGGFSERQITLAGTIGREVSLALENAHLLHEARSRAANLETIFRISQAVSSSLQSTVVLNRVLDVVQKIFSAEGVSLMTYDETRRLVRTAMARGIGLGGLVYLEVRSDEDLPGKVFAKGQAKIVGYLPALDTPFTRLAVEAGFQSLLAVPLLARGRSVGVLTVYSDEPDAFDEEDMELLQTFAAQGSLAIDTARLYGREHRVASVLQSSILPERLPDLSGVEASSVYRPAGHEAEIGGDYYDLFAAPDGRIVLVIGDVVGKGVVAATKTSMIRYSLRGMVAAGLGPADAMTALNRLVCESGETGDIVTVWLGFLDTAAGELTWASAGHPPALVLTPAERHVERLVPTGPVLGGIDGASYREERTTFPLGSVVLLYTDGVTEARRGELFFGEGRVRRALRAGGSAQAVAKRLMASVDRFAEHGLRDDAAVLAVRSCGSGNKQ